jgi:deoxyribonuclease V
LDIQILHEWPADYHGAVAQQKTLASRIVLKANLANPLSLVAGADVSGVASRGRIWAAVIVVEMPGFRLVEETFASTQVDFPYIPGLLSFRELPVVLEAFRQLDTTPDLVICDGQGLAHPRLFGLACHLGLWLNLPTIGCAKSRLVGEAQEPGWEAGHSAPLYYQGRMVGNVVRTRSGVKPVYVSPGHLMDLDTAPGIVLQCCDGKRLPEPTRLAHIAVNRYRREITEEQAGEGHQ